MQNYEKFLLNWNKNQSNKLKKKIDKCCNKALVKLDPTASSNIIKEIKKNILNFI